MKPIHLIIAVLVVFNIFLTKELLLKVPTIWPDEVVYAYGAENILKARGTGADLWGDMYPQFKQFTGAYPLVMYWFLAIWFAIFGLSIEVQRMLSVLASALLFLTLYFLAKTFFKKIKGNLTVENPWLWGLSISGLLVDSFFSQATRLSRPEIFILLFAVLSFHLYQKSFLSPGGKRDKVFLFLSGILAGLAALTHPVGAFILSSIILHTILTEGIKLIKTKRFYSFLTGFSLPVGVWFVSSFSQIGLIGEQLFTSTARKGIESTWLLSILGGGNIIHKLIFGSYLTVSLIYFAFLISYYLRYKSSEEEQIKINKKKYLLLGTFLFFSWSVALYGKMLWYYVYPIPFVYLAIVALWSKAIANSFSRTLLQGFFLILITVNVINGYRTYSYILGDKYSYRKLGEKVLRIVPEGKGVFLASSPDLYYAFKIRDKNQLYQFPALQAEKEKYFDLLGKTDYIVHTEPWIDLVFGDFLENYIEKNSLQVYKTTEPFEYEIYVFELKPRNERVFPD